VTTEEKEPTRSDRFSAARNPPCFKAIVLVAHSKTWSRRWSHSLNIVSSPLPAPFVVVTVFWSRYPTLLWCEYIAKKNPKLIPIVLSLLLNKREPDLGMAQKLLYSMVARHGGAAGSNARYFLGV
jgi:hypothetical protein